MPEALLCMGAGRGQEEGTEGGFEQTSGITTGVYILFHKGKLCQGVGFLVLLNGLRASDAGRPGQVTGDLVWALL